MNGIDSAIGARLTVAPDVAHLPSPRIGFVGSISEWIDLELIDTTGLRGPAPKMRAMKKAKESLPHVAYFNISETIVETNQSPGSPP